MSLAAMVKDGHLGGYFPGGDPGTWCPRLWTWAVQELGIRSVLDVGCGEGHSTRFFHDLGCRALGVDGCREAVQKSVLPGHVVEHDFCQGPFVPDEPFDLVWSCEFLEHVEEAYLPHILQTFAYAAKAVLVTHAFPGQRGHHHVNLQPTRYWIERIERAGFRCQPGLTRQARVQTLADYLGFNHFARSGLVFVRSSEFADHTGRLPAVETTAWSRLGQACRAHGRALAIQAGFRCSADYRVQKRKRRAAKRARKAAAANL